MKLSVIIVSYNVKPYLRQCLDSLYKALGGIDSEICVIDNHSKDGTAEWLINDVKDIKAITSNHNNGFAKANNIAIRQTTGEYVLMLNPDTFVGETTIKKCIKFMDANTNIGGLGVEMLNTDGSKASESRRGLPTPMTSFYKMCGLCSKFPANKRFGKYYMCNMPWDEPGQIEVISGAFFMVKRKVLNEVGLLDEDFFMYGEDIDLSYRILKHGYENWYLPVKILHYKGESTQKSSFRYIHVFYEAMLIFFHKHYGHLSHWLYIPIKSAIYFKATLALVGISSKYIKKMLGFRTKKHQATPLYIFFGTEKSLTRCREIADRNGLYAEYVEFDGTFDIDRYTTYSNKRNSSAPIYAVYDTSLYKYETILEIFSHNSHKNVFIGTFNPESKTIITNKEAIY